MTLGWQPLAAAAVALTVCAGTARAQTVIVKGAPEGTAVELAVNGAVVANGTADRRGFATLTVPARTGGPEQVETLISVDRCATLRRVVIASQGVTPIASGGCLRQSIPGLFATRSITTFVVDLSGTNPTLALTQGKPPDSWLRTPSEEAARHVVFGEVPKGLVLFGGAGFSFFQSLNEVACGNVPGCSSDAKTIALTGGAAFWFTPFLGAEARYVRPNNPSASGSGTTSSGAAYRFDSELESRILAITGLVAAPVNRTRLYARAGMNRHGATLRTTNVVEAGTITLPDGTTQSTNAGNTTQELRTEGWGWIFGGGVEVWLTHRIAVWGDLSRASIKGDAIDIPEGTIDQKPWLPMGGVRVKLF